MDEYGKMWIKPVVSKEPDLRMVHLHKIKVYEINSTLHRNVKVLGQGDGSVGKSTCLASMRT